MKKVILILLLLASWNASANGAGAVEAVKLAGGATILVARGFVVCAVDPSDMRCAKRAGMGSHGFFAREGLAFARVLTSPLNLVLPYFGIPYAYKDETSDFEYFVAMPGMIVLYACYGAVSTVDEVCVGTFEILTSLQVKSVYYPWESYSVSYDITRDAIRNGRASKAAEEEALNAAIEERNRKAKELVEQKQKNKDRHQKNRPAAAPGDDLGQLLRDLEDTE